MPKTMRHPSYEVPTSLLFILLISELTRKPMGKTSGDAGYPGKIVGI